MRSRDVGRYEFGWTWRHPIRKLQAWWKVRQWRKERSELGFCTPDLIDLRFYFCTLLADMLERQLDHMPIIPPMFDSTEQYREWVVTIREELQKLVQNPADTIPRTGSWEDWIDQLDAANEKQEALAKQVFEKIGQVIMWI